MSKILIIVRLVLSGFYATKHDEHGISFVHGSPWYWSESTSYAEVFIQLDTKLLRKILVLGVIEIFLIEYKTSYSKVHRT